MESSVNVNQAQRKSGEGRYQVMGVVNYCGRGVSFTIFGGEQPHIGSVVLSTPRPSLVNEKITSVTSSVLNVVGHKDEEVARFAAENAARRLNVVTVAAAGIHVEKAKPEELTILMKNATEVVDGLLSDLEERKCGASV